MSVDAIVVAVLGGLWFLTCAFAAIIWRGQEKKIDALQKTDEAQATALVAAEKELEQALRSKAARYELEILQTCLENKVDKEIYAVTQESLLREVREVKDNLKKQFEILDNIRLRLAETYGEKKVLEKQGTK